ncbi:hypothetical protein, partial [Mesorhizobium sp.]|uniref:hypothetical protein n=1 Tax=Mesorhizobium sp. TaxID=1871066 RepID=UPI0025BDC838
MQEFIGFEDMERLGERHIRMQRPSFARMPHPIDVESVWSDAVQPGERRVELLAAILLPARPKPLDEAVPP